ncbi:MAG: gliding motility-associated C-terminal domain-containing protein [Chryseolinea sp.]
MKVSAGRKVFLRICAIASLLMLCAAYHVQATHLRAGEITAVRENCSSLTYTITITVYTNTKNTTVLFGGDGEKLDFGDNEGVTFDEIENSVRFDLNPDGSVATASFTVTHTYPGVGRYVISYREPNRNEGVLNMDASINTTFYLETEVSVDPFLGCNNTPRLLVAPIDQACTGVTFTHNPGAYDPDGDSLSYSLVVPFSDRVQEVINYRSPNDQKFYTNFGTANEAGAGPPTFAINAVDGTLTWDAPGAIGEYNIAFHVIEWRKKNGVYYRVGYVRRDMQILVDECDNERPDLILPADTCVVAGTTLDATIFGIDPDNDDVKIEAFSEIFEFPITQSPATYTPVPDVDDFRPSTPPAETKFHWETECLHVKDQPYQVVFKITDNPVDGPKLVTFKTWFIRVVGPAPEWEDAELNLATRSTTLTWDPYFCQNAETMQVWRKVDGAAFEPDNCQTGMPEFLGYELINTLPIKSPGTPGNPGIPVTTYTDTNNEKGLAPGARYCYRLVAIFPLPRGGESYVSVDTCVGPILADVTIITHVTVDKTHQTEGEIRISWRKPFDADPVQFPPPYYYEIYRAVGFARGADSVNVSPPGQFADTTFVDDGLNTLENVYNYTITGYASNGGLLGTSAAASSVRLDANSEVKRIELNWSAFVPWSNQIQTFPRKHFIYRGPEGAVEADLVLIDSVDVSASGFVYLDEGQWNSQPLVDSETYCYRIMTRGGYGNPAIRQPLKNFSQIVCAQPGDTIPPCKIEPPMRSTLDYADCNEYYEKYCQKDNYSNIIMWSRAVDASCRNDVRSYNVYASSTKGGEFALIAQNVRDTFYIDNNLLSFARCYQVAAVDVSGNIGELSEALCIDNCPYYELPNVFTPNNDEYNDFFSAYSIRGYDCGEEGNCIPAELRMKCARFVQSVTFTVYNRWGQEVYEYFGRMGSETNTIYIDWNGKDNNGVDLSTGIYYYVAEVVFDSVDPQNNTKKIKGWVHLKL